MFDQPNQEIYKDEIIKSLGEVLMLETLPQNMYKFFDKPSNSTNFEIKTNIMENQKNVMCFLEEDLKEESAPIVCDQPLKLIKANLSNKDPNFGKRVANLMNKDVNKERQIYDVNNTIVDFSNYVMAQKV